MRLMPVLTLAISLAIAFSMITLSGVGTELGHNPQTQIDEEFDEAAEESESTEFDPDEGGDSLLGSTIAAVRAVESVLGVVIYMPSALESIGAPWWFARMIGHSAQIIIALGIAQIIRGFEIR